MKFDEVLKKIALTTLIAERTHHYLSQISSTYCATFERLKKKAVKKIGLRRSLLDEITAFVGPDPVWGSVKLSSPAQNSALQAFLYDNFSVEHVYRLKTGNQCSDDTKIGRGAWYLDTVDMADILEEDIQCITELIAEQPEFLIEHGFDPYREGLNVSRITFGHFQELPFVLQRKSEEGAMEISIIAPCHDALLQFREEVKNLKSFYAGWVCEYSGKEIQYIEKACVELRLEPREEKEPESQILTANARETIREIIQSLPPEYTTIIASQANLRSLNELGQMKFLFPLLLIVENVDSLLPTDGAFALADLIRGHDCPDNLKVILTANNLKGVHEELKRCVPATRTSEDDSCITIWTSFRIEDLSLHRNNRS